MIFFVNRTYFPFFDNLNLFLAPVNRSWESVVISEILEGFKITLRCGKLELYIELPLIQDSLILCQLFWKPIRIEVAIRAKNKTKNDVMIITFLPNIPH